MEHAPRAARAALGRGGLDRPRSGSLEGRDPSHPWVIDDTSSTTATKSVGPRTGGTVGMAFSERAVDTQVMSKSQLVSDVKDYRGEFDEQRPNAECS